MCAHPLQETSRAHSVAVETEETRTGRPQWKGLGVLLAAHSMDISCSQIQGQILQAVLRCMCALMYRAMCVITCVRE